MEDLQTALAPEQGHAVLQPAALRHAGTNNTNKSTNMCQSKVKQCCGRQRCATLVQIYLQVQGIMSCSNRIACNIKLMNINNVY
jgi:hypothetical protein